jgi:hypothetical protein
VGQFLSHHFTVIRERTFYGYHRFQDLFYRIRIVVKEWWYHQERDIRTPQKQAKSPCQGQGTSLSPISTGNQSSPFFSPLPQQYSQYSQDFSIMKSPELSKLIASLNDVARLCKQVEAEISNSGDGLLQQTLKDLKTQCLNLSSSVTTSLSFEE